MKKLVFMALVGACSGRAQPGAGKKQPAGSAPGEARCSAFADRVVACAVDTSITPALSEDEKHSMRASAYGACTKTTHDEATLHYYGDVDRKIACMQGQSCAGVRACLTSDDPAGSASPAQ